VECIKLVYSRVKWPNVVNRVMSYQLMQMARNLINIQVTVTSSSPR